MKLARVVGSVVASHKEPALSGLKLLVLEPVRGDGSTCGARLVAADSVGAGVGELVFFVRGREASLPFLPTVAPIDAAVVGIVDHAHLDDGARPDAARPARP